MLIDIQKLYFDYGISIAPIGHKHARSQWVQSACPFCKGSEGYHLGYNTQKGYFHCWRCGWHPIEDTIKTLLKIKTPEIGFLLKQYRLRKPTLEPKSKGKNEVPYTLVLPSGRTPVSGPYTRYLQQRGFDAKEIEKTWDVSCIGINGPVGWRWRLFIPIYFYGEIVSYQTRAISSEKAEKYKACPQEKEVIQHKHILYGVDYTKDKDKVVLVEGVADVWKLGPGACATFGTQTKPSQRVFVANHYKRVFVLFDNDENEAGQIAGEKLAWQLSGMGLKVEQVILDKVGDPGSLEKSAAQNLMRNLGF